MSKVSSQYLSINSYEFIICTIQSPEFLLLGNYFELNKRTLLTECSNLSK